MDQITNILKLMSAIGLPTLIGLIAWLVNTGKKINILMKAQQSQMRSQLLQQYHYHIVRGWISEDDMEDWENQYQSYHALGKNGVLDARRQQLLALPSTPVTGVNN